MKVNLYEIGASAPFARDVDVREAMGDDAEEFERVVKTLCKRGHAIVGGGAAPLIYLVRAFDYARHAALEREHGMF